MTPEPAALPPLPSSTAAVCPVHPERPSLGSCARCGRFACAQCWLQKDPPRCVSCDSRLCDPLGILATPFSGFGALAGGWKLFVASFGRVWPVALLFGILGGLTSYALARAAVDGTTSLRLQVLFEGTIGLVCTGAYLAVLTATAEGAPMSFRRSLSVGASAFGRMFGARFRAGAWILLFTLLLVIPGIMKGVALSMVEESVFREPGTDPLRASTRLTDGHRWPLFGMLLLSYLSLVVTVPVSVVAELFSASGSPFAAGSDVAVDILQRLAGAFIAAVGLAAFYGLKRTFSETLPPLPYEAQP